MNKKTTTWVWYSAIPLWLLILFAQKNPEIVEKYYSRFFYPLGFSLHHFFMNSIPFSLGDLCYLLLIFYSIKTIVKKSAYWKIKPFQFFLDIGTIVIITAWIFHLSWGFNYHRLPLNEQLNIPIKYSKKDLEICMDKIIERSNYWHQQLVSSDTLKVKLPFSKDEAPRKTILYDPIHKKTVFHNLKVKKSLLSLPLSYMGYAGYLNPFTLESQVNAKMPVQSLIMTSLHETAHQLGYASEKEANFIAYLSAIKHENPHIQYTGNTFAFRYLYSELYKLDSDLAMEKLNQLNPGILKDFREVARFWKQYENPFEIIFEKTYDGYLKANGQKSGIKSYNEMIGLVINYHKNE